MALKVGEVNLKVMGMLDQGNTGTYGHPEPTVVRVTPKKGKAILVSGHDLRDLELLLEADRRQGHQCLYAWRDAAVQRVPGAEKIQTSRRQLRRGVAGPGERVRCVPGFDPDDDQLHSEAARQLQGAASLRRGWWRGRMCKHIGKDKDFAPVIHAALAAPGFAEDAEEKTITVGFGRNAVLSVAPAVIDAVKAGKIRHFFLVGGCDGARPGRNYYTDFAKQMPDDCVILTLACGKYRFNKLPFGDIGGIPRLLDIGQCNDAYSAIQIAVALAGAFNCSVNDLPLTMILSWYEQKAVCILLSLLHLGIQNMRLGPTLPAFIGPNVLNVLVDKFKIAPITTPEQDLKTILG